MGFETIDLNDPNAAGMDLAEATFVQLDESVAELVVSLSSGGIAVPIADFIAYLRTKEVVDVDDLTIEHDETDGLRVKEDGLNNSHISSEIGDDGKQEFRNKINAAADYQLTRDEIIDENSEAFGEISGERFKQAFDEHAPDVLEPSEIEDETSVEEGLISGERFKEGFDHHLANADVDEHVSGNPFTQEYQDKLDGVEEEATQDQTAGEIATAMENRVRDAHIADDLTENEKAEARSKLGADTVNVDDETIENDDTDGLRVKAGGIRDDHIADDLTPEEKSEARSRLGADTVDVDDETIENDDTDGLRVKAGGLDDSHIKENLSAAEKQEFRHRIDAEEEGAGGGGGSGIISEAVGTSGSMAITPAQTFISTGITLPSASEADWILLMMSFTSFDYAEWIWIRLQDILDLNASEVDDTPRTSTDVNDFIVIPHPLVSDNSDILLGRTSTNVLLIGTYQASVTFAGITVTLRRVSESTNGGGGSGEDTDITIERDADSVDVQSSTGGDGTIPAADTDSAGVMTADQFDKLESIPDDITEPLLIFARSTTEPHHPTGAVSDTGVLSLDGEWDRFIPLAVGGSRSGTISLHANNANSTGVARHGGQTYVSNDGPTTNDKRFFCL